MTFDMQPFATVREGFTIRGEKYVPSERRLPFPVIISHGFTGCMKETRPYAWYLASHGIVTYVYDFCGGGLHTTSDGDYHTQMTPLTEIEDLRAVLAYVPGDDRTADGAPACPVLVGCSQGGFVSALLAPEVADQIRALALLYPALCIPDDARAGSMQFLTFDPQDVPDVLAPDHKLWISGDYARSVMDIDVFERIIRYTGDVLIMHGTQDSIVPVRYAQQGREAYEAAGARVTFYLVEGCDHTFYEDYFDEAVPHLRAFLCGLA